MTTDYKVTELFCIIDEFCKHFDAENAGNLLEDNSGVKRRRRQASLSDSEIMTILLHFPYCIRHSVIPNWGSYVIVKGDRIVATFVLRGGADPTYDIIYNGKWPDDNPYATIHRIASSGEATGIMHTALQYALTLYDNIRIDTHRDNLVMQHLLADEGFSYCGVIHCWSGDERLAFQLTKKG